MPENQTRPTKSGVPAFIEAIKDEGRRAEASALVRLMQAATHETPVMWGPAIIGFGSRHYKYDSGREGDSPIVGYSPRKAAHVLYGTLSGPDAEALLAKLGKHTTGKGCLHIKRLADVDLSALETLVAGAFAAKAE